MMDWDNLRIFLMLARLQSLSAAGARLKIDAATVGRRIQRLEATVGQPLFLRSQQGYRLTEAGERLVAHAETMESASRHVFETVSDTGAQLTGKIRIGAPDGCATYLLPQIIGHLVAENPALEVQVVSLPRIFDLSRREADIAISVSRPDAGARLTVRKVADYGLSLAAHRDYLSAHPPIRSAAEIAGHRLIGYIPDLIVDPQLDYLAQITKTAPVLSSNSVPVQLAWMRQGLGLGIVHDFVLPHFPELVRVLPAFALTRSFWLVRHADDRSPRMSRFADALTAGLRQSLT